MFRNKEADPSWRATVEAAIKAARRAGQDTAIAPEAEFYTIGSSLPPADISFSAERGDGPEMLRLCEDGRILVRGKEVADDVEVYHALREFLGLSSKR